MELIISTFAIIISFISIIVSITIYHAGIRRQKKQATLDAFNLLQEQVFDKLNLYTINDIEQICETWRNRNKKSDDINPEDRKKLDMLINEYHVLSSYLARIEHFALGVNTDIYDAKIAERAGTTYLTILYKKKLKPIIDEKHKWARGKEYYAEFRLLVEDIERIENMKK